jgi:MscS family membrane protein
VEELPEGLQTVHGGQALWQWIGILLSVVAVALVTWMIYRVLKRTAQRLRSPLEDWAMILTPIAVAIIVGLVVSFIDNDINATGTAHKAVVTVGSVIVIAMAAWAVFLLCRALAETLIATPRIGDHSSEAALLRIGWRVIGVLLAAWIAIDGIRGLGVNLIPLLAGLGVGGLALALAAQSTIANFIGGLILFANKPVRVGDFCRYGEDPNPDWLRIGTVEEIDLLSTRIRGIDRTITTIPNAEFSTMHIVNLTQRDRRLLRTTLQLRYETTPEQLRFVLAKLRELLLGHPMVTPDPARVRFIGYGAYSLNLEIFAYLRCIEQNEFLAIQEDLFLRMADIVAKAGTAFAFPSQTTYLARDSGLDAELRDSAEGQVEHWRGRGKLPFPEFEDEERERLEDILDYPPKGSPDHKPRSG